MPIELTNEQSKTLEEIGLPSQVADPRTQKTYILLSLEVFEKIKAMVSDSDYALADTYAAQMESAWRAGWNDPAMDEYNDYDSHRKP